MIRALAAALLAVLYALPAAAADDPPVVVELFTSQGCSSCPPADKYFGQLAKRPDILALAFHVEYWNYIGWIDPYSRPWATRRQRDYEAALKLRYIYTPEIVVDGAAEGVASEPGVVEPLIRAAKAEKRPRPDLTLRWRDDGALVVQIGLGHAAAGNLPATLWLVGYDNMHAMPVTAGENKGMTAWDNHPVRTFRRLGMWLGAAEEIVVGADDARGLGENVAVLLQVDGTGPIITAATIARQPPTPDPFKSGSAAKP